VLVDEASLTGEGQRVSGVQMPMAPLGACLSSNSPAKTWGMLWSRAIRAAVSLLAGVFDAGAADDSVVTWPVTPEPPVCPGCGEDRLIEFDEVQRRWQCAVCSCAWSTRNGERRAPIPHRRARHGTVDEKHRDFFGTTGSSTIPHRRFERRALLRMGRFHLGQVAGVVAVLAAAVVLVWLMRGKYPPVS
jgi:hypothetical protein